MQSFASKNAGGVAVGVTDAGLVDLDRLDRERRRRPRSGRRPPAGRPPWAGRPSTAAVPSPSSPSSPPSTIQPTSAERDHDEQREHGQQRDPAARTALVGVPAPSVRGRPRLGPVGEAAPGRPAPRGAARRRWGVTAAGGCAGNTAVRGGPPGRPRPARRWRRARRCRRCPRPGSGGPSMATVSRCGGTLAGGCCAGGWGSGAARGASAAGWAPRRARRGGRGDRLRDRGRAGLLADGRGRGGGG